MTDRLRNLLLPWSRRRVLPGGATERIDRDGRIRIERPQAVRVSSPRW